MSVRREIAALDRLAADLDRAEEAALLSPANQDALAQGRAAVPPAPTHKFERAGLGKAPFRVTGFSREVFQAIPGDPNCPIQPGTSCDYCGQGIMYVAWILSADGKRFKVGTNCVEQTGDRGLIKAAKTAEAKILRERRWNKNAEKVDAIKAMLADPAVAATLASHPHPREWAAKQGKTLLDWAEWMMQNAGVRGKIEVGKVVAAAMKAAT